VNSENPTDCVKKGAKLHLLVNKRDAPLVVHVTGANEYDKWSADKMV
jgi:hypothetical protein